jgi:hypothetical protein
MLSITISRTHMNKCLVVIVEDDVEIVRRTIDKQLSYELVDDLPTIIKCNCHSLHPDYLQRKASKHDKVKS